MAKQDQLNKTDSNQLEEGLGDSAPEGAETPQAPEVNGEVNDTDSKIAQLENELAALKQERDELYNKMLRTQADFENFRRRSRQEFEQLAHYSGEDLIKKLLPVLDSIERAVACSDLSSENFENWRDGIVLILRQLQNLLAGDGLEEIPAVNEMFDPQFHEAVLQEKSDQVERPTVVEEMQKGYKYKGKLIRPSLVKVAVPDGDQ